MPQVTGWVETETLETANLGVVGLTSPELTGLRQVGGVVRAKPFEWHPKARNVAPKVDHNDNRDKNVAIELHLEDIKE